MDGGEGERRPRHPCGSKSPATVIATSAHHGGYVVGRRRRLRRVISAPPCLILDPRDRPRRPIVFACPQHETQVLGVHYITNTSRKSTAQPLVSYRDFTRDDARHHANPNHINTVFRYFSHTPQVTTIILSLVVTQLRGKILILRSNFTVS